MDEITYTPGRLGKKLGISKATLMRHLRRTGLIDQCLVTEHGHYRIPYSVAVRLSSPEALAVPVLTPTTRRSVEVPLLGGVGVGGTPTANLEHYSQIGKVLTSAGITIQDLINYYYQQREQPEADKVASRSEKGGNGGTANRV